MPTRLTRLGRWLFAEGAPESLSLLRLLFGALAAWQVATFMARAELWLSAKGWLRSACFPLVSGANFSLLKGVHDDRGLWLFAAATLVAALCMSVGCFSRTATVATWLGLTSLQARLDPVLDGGDIVTQFVVFYLCFARTGERFAVDRRLFRRPARATVPLWPQKLIAFQVSLVYLSAFLHKLGDRCWLDGSAVYFALQYADNKNFWLPAFLRLPPATTLLTYGTLAIECGLGVLPLVPRFRRGILLAGVALHLGIAYALFIPFFAPAMLASYVAFFRGEELPRRLIRSPLSCSERR